MWRLRGREGMFNGQRLPKPEMQQQQNLPGAVKRAQWCILVIPPAAALFPFLPTPYPADPRCSLHRASWTL